MEKTCLCVCRNDNEECPIAYLMRNGAENQFKTLSDVTEQLYGHFLDARLQNDANAPDLKPGHKMWKWTEVKDCHLYYVFVYNRDGDRIREHEIVSPPKQCHHQIPDTLKLKVISLFKKQLEPGEEHENNHRFVEIYKASGLGEYGMVIDLLSAVILKGRFAIYFGFLTTSDTNFSQSTRIAIKKESVAGITETGQNLVPPTNDRPQDGVSREALQRNSIQIRKEIDLALQAGGQYNMKYLACTTIEGSMEIWIALELCRMEIFKDLIMADETSRIFLTHQKMKVCFNHILHGLMQLHRKGIKHGEITAENILVSLDGAELKIGDYDHVKEVRNRHSAEETTIEDDILMTARVFMKSLKRDATKDSKCLDDADEEAIKQWVESQQPCEPDVLNDDITHASIKAIIEVVFYEMKRNSIPSETRIHEFAGVVSWFTLLKNLVDELMQRRCKDPYLSAYLIIHMAVDIPPAIKIRTHPFFYDEYKIECFVRRMFDWFGEVTHGAINENSRDPNERSGEELLKEDIMRNFQSARQQISCLKDITETEYCRWPVLLLRDEMRLSSTVCLLHRAVWLRRSSQYLPGYIKKFLDEQNSLDFLNLPRSY